MQQPKEYLDHPGMRQSSLKHILDGVDEYRLHRDNPWRPTEEQQIGSAVHVLVLEPQKACFITSLPKFDGKTRLGKIFNYLMQGRTESFFPLSNAKTKRQGEGFFYEVDYPEYEFMIGNLMKYGHIFRDPASYIALSEPAYETAQRMAENVRKNTDVSMLLSQSVGFETIRYFTYRGLQFKCILDQWGLHNPLTPFTADLKSTFIKNDDYAIEREIRSRRYNFQGALYLLSSEREDMFDAEGNFTEPYYIEWVRNVEPHTVFPTRMRVGLLREGLEDLNNAIDLYKDCLEHNPEFIADNRLRTV